MSSDMDIEQQPALDRDVADDLNSSAEDEKTILEPSEERRLVKSVEVTKKMKKGDTYYVIESVWFKKWKDYVNYNEYLSADGSSRPGPIENGNLLDGTDQLKKNVHERWEYEVICEDSWRLLFKWYGGGPAIPRTVIASRSEYNLVVEVRPLTLKMVRSSDPQKTEHLVYYSRVDTVGKLKTDMVAKFNLDPEKFRLWDYHASRKIKMLTVSSEKLEDAQIIDFQLVLIEEQVDGKWPPDPTPTYYSNSYNYSQPPSHPGLVGLNNLGNTCFMNSALQCLSNTVPLVQFLLSDRFKEDINETNPLGTGGQLTEEFSKLLKDIWTGNSNMVAPREFKYKLERFAPQFQGYNQHDSQELLAFLLDGLHEDLNRIKKKPYVATIEAEGRPDTEVAEESWKGHRSRNDSFIVDWFQAQLKSTLICPIETCKKISVTFDPFMYLSLPLPIKNTRVITFTLVYLDTARLPVKYHIKINKYATINDLKTAISELVEHKIQPENIVLTDVYGNRFFKEFKDTLDSIQDRDVVVGFEIQPQTPKAPEGQIPNEPEIVYLPLLNRKEEVYTFTQYSASTYVSKPLFGNPQVLSLQKKVTARQVYEAVQNKLSRFIKKDVEAENQDPNKNPYFVVKVVRKVSYTEEEVDLPLNDDVVELQDRQNLVAFWSNWAVTNAYNVAAEKEVEEHSSCSLTEESEDSSLSLQTSVTFSQSKNNSALMTHGIVTDAKSIDKPTRNLTSGLFHPFLSST